MWNPNLTGHPVFLLTYCYCCCCFVLVCFLAESSNLNSETLVLYSTLLLINSMILVELLSLGFPNSSARLLLLSHFSRVRLCATP